MANRVLGVLAAQEMSPITLGAWARSADMVLAADGAAKTLHALGIPMRLAIGDFDSSSSDHHALAQEVIHVPDQDSTDCDKLLAWCASNSIQDLTLIDAEGGRFDHTLAVLYSVAKGPVQNVRIIYNRGTGHVLRPDQNFTTSLAAGTTFSVLPLTASTVTIQGAKWPVTNKQLEPTGDLSISNAAAGGKLIIHQHGGTSFLYIVTDTSQPVW